MRRIHGEVSKKQASIANRRTSEGTRARLRAEVDGLYSEMLDALRATRFARARFQGGSGGGGVGHLATNRYKAGSRPRAVQKSLGRISLSGSTRSDFKR